MVAWILTVYFGAVLSAVFLGLQLARSPSGFVIVEVAVLLLIGLVYPAWITWHNRDELRAMDPKQITPLGPVCRAHAGGDFHRVPRD